MPQEYTQEKFESDLKELGLMLENEMKGGAKRKSKKVASKKKSSKKVSSKKMVSKKVSSKKMGSMKKRVSKKRVSKKGGSKYEEEEELKSKYEKVKSKMLKGGYDDKMMDQKMMDHKVEQEQNGGLSNSKRHFKISELNGKEVDFGSAEIKSDRTPLSAAKKLLKSIAHHMGMYGNDKAKLSVTFKIRETTRGHAKEYGPYHGKYHKYSANELKDAMTKGGKIAFKMKPVVKKLKNKGEKKNNKMMNHKGGR